MRLGDATGAAHFGLALALLAEKRYSDALSLLLAAVEADPKDPDKLFTLVATQVQLKHLIGAKRNVSRLEALAGRDPWIFFRLGKLLQEHGMFKEADAEFERAAASLAETKDSPPPHLKLSDLYLQMARLRFDRQDYFSALECPDEDAIFREKVRHCVERQAQRERRREWLMRIVVAALPSPAC